MDDVALGVHGEVGRERAAGVPDLVLGQHRVGLLGRDHLQAGHQHPGHGDGAGGADRPDAG